MGGKNIFILMIFLFGVVSFSNGQTIYDGSGKLSGSFNGIYY